MKNNLTKIIFSLLLIFSIIFSLFSCVSNGISDITKNTFDKDIQPSKETYIGDNIMDYNIIQVDGNYYMVFDDISLYVTECDPEELAQPITFVDFESVSEMQNAILNGKLTHFQKNIIAERFFKDNNGVMIMNPYNVYTIKHPSVYYEKNPSVSMIRSGYTWDTICSENTSTDKDYWLYMIVNKKYYEAQLQEKFKQYVENNSIEFNSEQKLSDGRVIKRSVNIFETEKNRTYIRYVLSDSNKIVFVEKTYRNDNISNIFLLAMVDQNKYFEISLIGQNTYSDETLTDEFLFGFDLEEIKK